MLRHILSAGLCAALLVAPGCQNDDSAPTSTLRNKTDETGDDSARGVTDPAQCGCGDGQVCLPDHVTSDGVRATGARFTCEDPQRLTDCTLDNGGCADGQVCVVDYGCNAPDETVPADAPGIPPDPNGGQGRADRAAPPALTPDPVNPDNHGNVGCHWYCIAPQQAGGEGAPCAPRDGQGSSLALVCAEGLHCVPDAVGPDGRWQPESTGTCQSQIVDCTYLPSTCDDLPGTTCITDPNCHPDLDSVDCRRFCAQVLGWTGNN